MRVIYTSIYFNNNTNKMTIYNRLVKFWDSFQGSLKWAEIIVKDTNEQFSCIMWEKELIFVSNDDITINSK